MSFLLNIVSWLLGSKVGRIAVFALAGLTLGGVIVFMAFRKGRSSLKAEQVQRTLEHVLERVAVDEAVSRMPRDVRRERLRSWAR